MGIDVLFNVVAAIAFLIGIGGIVLAVMNTSRGQSARMGVLLAIIGLVLGVLSTVVSAGLLSVGPTQRAVVFNVLTGELGDEPLEPGLHVIIPGLQQSFIYPVSRQEYTMSGTSTEGAQAGDDAIQARSIDGQDVFVDVTIIFTITPEDVEEVHRNWSDVSQGYLLGLIRPTVRSIVRDVIATAEAEQIFGGSRTEIQAEIERITAEELGAEGFTVVSVLIREVNFSDEFINAIERRQVAELDRDRASIEAETARIEAGGRADARIEQARGDAEAVRIQAIAEAEALRLVSEQIAANPNLIQYTYITELSDNVEMILVPSNSPFLFDLASFTDVGSDFSAPENPTIEDTSTDSSGD